MNLKIIKKEISQTFNNEDYEKEKAIIEQEFETKKRIREQLLRY